MTRERAKELLPIISAYAEGKTIQYKRNDVWTDAFYQTDISFDINSTSYRVKPEETNTSSSCCGHCGCGED
jgi:hypothetical protein